MSSAIVVLWIFLANGNVVSRDYPSLDSCLATQSAIQIDHQVRGDRSISRMLCVPEALR